jgi:hypothetical protein
VERSEPNIDLNIMVTTLDQLQFRVIILKEQDLRRPIHQLHLGKENTKLQRKCIGM